MAKETKLRRADAKSAETKAKTAAVGSIPGSASSQTQSPKTGTTGTVSTNTPKEFEAGTSIGLFDVTGLSAVYTSRVWSYRVDADGLNLVLKNEKDRSFSCNNGAPHYAAVLSMIIVAASTNALVSLRYSDQRQTLPITYPIAQFGLGENPLSDT